MTLTQIQYFLTVTEQGSFSAAAAEMFVSQPAVSKQISQLETELGFRLFDRTDRRVQLTPDGRRMYEAFRRSVDEVRALVEDIRRKTRDFSGEVRIGCLPLWNASLFFQPLSGYFAENHPDARLTLEACDMSELVPALRRGEIDLALCYEGAFEGKSDLSVTRIRELGCGLLYSRFHFGDCGEKGARAFAGVPLLVGSSEENAFASLARQVCEDNGLKGKLMPERRTNSIVMDTQCGSGVMLVTEWTRLVSNSVFGYQPLDLKFPVGAAYLRGTVSGQKLQLISEVIWALKNG